jgi:dienelactone hydrolase
VEDDEFVPPEAVRALRTDLEATGGRVAFEVRSGVRHGFMNPARPDVYDAAAAVDGWNALLSFLRAELP